ncbi:hypothetical protein B0O80DRAFT_526767 [Mortierella sp. GBAus27b]|nr:hypothetical protein B0O80DRAFT_526767 [Mortierella sp. GBAus27b]
MDVLYEDLFKILDKSRETITRLEVISSVREWKKGRDLFRLWHVLSDDRAMHHMSRLRHLRLEWVNIRPEDGCSEVSSAFAKLCQRLESLECINCTMVGLMRSMWKALKDTDNGDSPPTPPWSLKRLAFVEMKLRLPFHVCLLRQCPFLEHLTWSSRTNQHPGPGFLKFLAHSRLKFLWIKGLTLSDESFAQLMEHLPSTFTTLAFESAHPDVQVGPLFVAAATALTSPILSLLSSSGGPLRFSSTFVQ